MPEAIRSLGALLAAAAALLLGAGCAGADRPRNEGGFVGGEPSLTRIAPEQRTVAPVVTGAALGADGTLSTADYPGEVVVLNVWGSWCAPCRKEAADLQGASEETKAVAQFIGLNTRDNAEANSLAFNRRFGVSYPSIFDPGGTALIALHEQVPPKAIPSTLVIDREGRIAARVTGTITKITLVDLIEDVAAGR